MDANAAKASHARTLNETVYVRRYSGAVGSRTYVDYAARADIMGLVPHELVGAVVQGDRKAVVLADDLSDNGLTLPVLNTDKLVVRGKELSIMAVDDNTRRVSGVLIAYELVVRG